MTMINNKKNIIISILILIASNTIFLFAQNEIGTNSLLSKYNFDEPRSQFVIKDNLNEISGLALFGENLAAHNDERAVIYLSSIAINKTNFYELCGKRKAKDDFEGIAVVDDNFVLVTSSGKLYFAFSCTDDKTDFKIVKTFLTGKDDVEGLCYDPTRNFLLLACKAFSDKEYKQFRFIYEYDLKGKKLIKNPRFKISLMELDEKFGIKDFSPTGIEFHPASEHFFILSSNDKAIVELNYSGEIINAVKLNPKDHRQPEGITFLNNNSLVISDEGDGKKPRIAIYLYND